jgi:predicted ATPase
MSIAIAALAAAVAVVLALSGITTRSATDTLLNALLSQKNLTPEDASSVIAYSIFVYLVAFSSALFVLRVLGLFAAALGIPNEEQIRLNRALQRQDATQRILARAQARLIAHYIVRAEQVVARQRASQRSTPTETPKT